MSLRSETLFVLLVATGMDACAMSRMAQAEVQSVNGVPFFTISAKEERRNGQPYLGALIVSDLTD